MDQAAGVELAADDALGNATRLRVHCGWSVLGGFILFERAANGDAHLSASPGLARIFKCGL